ALGCSGRFPFLKTPNMDRLAREGAQFANAFVTTSLCSPSRACFLTGCYAHRHGVRTNEHRDPDPALTTFPQALQRAGYETAFVGKWHMRPVAEPRPGFDYWLSFRGQGQYLNPELNENGRAFRAEGYMTDLLTRYAVDWIEQPRDKPFCLLLWHKAVHGPFTPADRHANAFPDARLPEPASFSDSLEGRPAWMRRARLYGARMEEWRKSEGKSVPDAVKPGSWSGTNRAHLDYMRALMAVDESLGAVLASLEARGQLDNTLVVFTSDNGFFLGEHGRGDKRLAYDESLRIPLLMRYPGLVEAGSVIDPMALNIDLGPTFLDLAGARIPRSMQGASLLPLLRGDSRTWRKSFLYEYFQESWLPGIPTMTGVRTERWKYVQYPHVPGELEELYDLRADPIEVVNLATDPAHAGTLADMRAELARLKKQTGYTAQDAEPRTHVRVPLQLALHYTFTTVSADTVRDESGNGHDGIAQGARLVAGRVGKALEFSDKALVRVEPAPDSLSPAMKPFAVGAWVNPAHADGVIASFGGQSQGFSLYLRNALPHFTIRASNRPAACRGTSPVPLGKWSHIVAVLTQDAGMRLYVNGECVAENDAGEFIAAKPNEGFYVGADAGTPAGDYPGPLYWQGRIGEIRVYWGELSSRRVRRWFRGNRV
ncbi:MAG: sulfatase-like hydrolase/transferase, partial [Candidatus Hydrogenedentes bacterium]|nr:sulfatase-like hydrolase/transferase [Candidatus Hydrogenedentota bacterium]